MKAATTVENGRTMLGRRLRRAAAWLTLAALALPRLSGCAYVIHDLKDYEGEVFLTPAPRDIPRDRLVRFRVSDSYIRLIETVPIYWYSLDRCLDGLNPNRYPIYELRLDETFEWWEILVLFSTAILGVPDSRTVTVEGVIAVPPEDMDWTYEPSSFFHFGPTYHRVNGE